MTRREFEVAVEDRIAKIRLVLTKKGDEYATDDNAFHNIEDGAAFRERSPSAYCMDLLTKHLISVSDIVKEMEARYNCIAEEMIAIDRELVDEKFGDLINYLIILEAIIKEKI